MKFNLVRELPVPIGTQLKNLIMHGIGFGELMPGERLPSVRALAKTLDIAPMTVMQVYRELNNAELTASRPGSGTFVLGIGDTIASPAAADDRDRLHHTLDMLVDHSISLGLSAPEVSQMVTDRMHDRQPANRRYHITVVTVDSHHACGNHTQAVRDILDDERASVSAVTLAQLIQDHELQTRIALSDIVLVMPCDRQTVRNLLPRTPIALIRYLPVAESCQALERLDSTVRALIIPSSVEFTAILKAIVQRLAPRLKTITTVQADDLDLAALLHSHDVLIHTFDPDRLPVQFSSAPRAIMALECRYTPNPADVRHAVASILGAPAKPPSPKS